MAALRTAPKRVAKRVLSEDRRRALRRRLAWPRVGRVQFGALRRVEPIERGGGWARGLPIDRYYIERFLGWHASDIRGRVVEIKDDSYTRRFSRSGAVERSDVLDVGGAERGVTIVADLADARDVPDESFDCFICTQTLQFVFDVEAAVATIHRVLRPGGVALVTLPGIAAMCGRETAMGEAWADYWRFTSFSGRRLFGDAFGADNVEVEVDGNALAAVAFLHGLAAEELTLAELDARDVDFELLIAVRARKAP